MLQNILYQFCFLGVVLLMTNVSCVSLSKECGKTNLVENVHLWNVGIYLKEKSSDLELTCLGTVIKSNAILTAAHCISDGFSENLRPGATFYVKLGDLPKKIATSDNHDLFEVKKSDIYMNDHFKGLLNHLSDDIVVIKINNPAFSNNVQPVCVDWALSLPALAKNQAGYQAMWEGKTVRLADVTFVDYQNCLLDALENLKTFISDRTFCGKTKGSFSAIAGAGLLFSHNNKGYLRGVSSTIDLSEKRTSIYTDLSLHINWLSNVCAAD